MKYIDKFVMHIFLNKPGEDIGIDDVEIDEEFVSEEG